MLKKDKILSNSDLTNKKTLDQYFSKEFEKRYWYYPFVKLTYTSDIEPYYQKQLFYAAAYMVATGTLPDQNSDGTYNFGQSKFKNNKPVHALFYKTAQGVCYLPKKALSSFLPKREKMDYKAAKIHKEHEEK